MPAWYCWKHWSAHAWDVHGERHWPSAEQLASLRQIESSGEHTPFSAQTAQVSQWPLPSQPTGPPVLAATDATVAVVAGPVVVVVATEVLVLVGPGPALTVSGPGPTVAGPSAEVSAAAPP